MLLLSFTFWRVTSFLALNLMQSVIYNRVRGTIGTATVDFYYLRFFLIYFLPSAVTLGLRLDIPMHLDISVRLSSLTSEGVAPNTVCLLGRFRGCVSWLCQSNIVCKLCVPIPLSKGIFFARLPAFELPCDAAVYGFSQSCRRCGLFTPCEPETTAKGTIFLPNGLAWIFEIWP